MMKHSIFRRYGQVGWFALMLSAGCGAEAPANNVASAYTGDDSSALLAKPLAADLNVGSRGAEVRAVYDALHTHGYFPNADLQDRYPAWRPLVADAPSAADVFDAHTAAAVSAFQRNAGLPETGVVNAETWTALGGQYCGVPEGILRPGGSEKYDFGNGKWDKPVVVWRVNSVTNSGLTKDVVRTQVGIAFNKWHAAATELSFREATSSDIPDIEISFGARDGDVAGHGNFPDDGGNDKGGDIIIDNTNRVWTTGTPLSGQTSLTMVLIHEIGHAIGLAHSTNPTSVMRGDGEDPLTHTFNTDLKEDDKAAIRTLYSTWHQDSGLANVQDIASGGDGTDDDAAPEVWAVAGTAVAGGFRVYRRDPNGWQEAISGGAVGISVDSLGRPWIVQNNGDIYRYTASIANAADAKWEHVEGCAVDIGASGTAKDAGSVWRIGCDGLIYRWKVSTSNVKVSGPWSEGIPGGISRIAVDESTNAWVVADDQTIWRSDSTLHWEQMPGNPVGTPFEPALGLDVGVGPKNYAYVVGGDQIGYTWDQQAAGTKELPAVQRYDWIGIGGGLLRIAVGKAGAVWGVGLDHKAYHFGVL